MCKDCKECGCESEEERILIMLSEFSMKSFDIRKALKHIGEKKLAKSDFIINYLASKGVFD